MAQHDYDIANASGASVRSDINNVLSAIVSQNSGASAPSTTFAYMFWVDTTNGLVKRRNSANSGWINYGPAASTMVQSKSTAYTVLPADYGTLLSCTSTFTISVTAAATLGDGHVFGARNDGTGIITIDPNSSEQIDGATTIRLYPGESCIVWCTGTAFKTQGRSTGPVIIESKSISGATTVDFTTGLDDTFDRFEIEFSAIKMTTDDVYLAMRYGTGAGPTYSTAGYLYGAGQMGPGGIGDMGSTLDSISDRILLTRSGTGNGIGNAAGEYADGVIEFANPDGTSIPNFRYRVNYIRSDAVPTGVVGFGGGTTSATVTGVRLFPSSGTLSTGAAILRGWRK